MPVAIVGGGMAGLHAAYRLRQRGLFAAVYEAGRRIGGRMFTDRDTFSLPDGQHCELGGELIDTGHVTMLDLAAELGLPLLDYRNETALEPDRYFFGGRIVPESEILVGFTLIAAEIDRALAGAADPDVLPSYTDDNGLGALDQLSISGWLDSIAAGGPARALLELAYTIEFGLEASAQSALNLLTMISSDTTDLALFGVSDERYTCAVGNDAFCARLAAVLDPSQVALEQALVRLELRSDGRYLLSFDGAGGAREVVAERVILTLPFTKLREVELVGVPLPDAKRRAIAELGYGTNTKLMVGFTQRPWRGQGSLGGSYTDVGYQATWETSRLQEGATGILTNYTGGQHGLDIALGTDEEQRMAFLVGLDQVFPGAAPLANGKVARYAWPSSALHKGSYSAYKVGQWTSFGGAEGERVGNLLFAGEHTSRDAQGFMEGAALSGAMAAETVASDLGLPVAQALSLPAARIEARARLTLRTRSWKTAARQGATRRRARR